MICTSKKFRFLLLHFQTDVMYIYMYVLLYFFSSYSFFESGFIVLYKANNNSDMGRPSSSGNKS
jgi:hypothetical protein